MFGGAKPHEYTDNDHQCRSHDAKRVLAQIADRPGIPAHEASHFAGIAVFRFFDLGQVRRIDSGLAGKDGTQGGRKDQGHEDRRSQHEEQGERQEAHELAGDRVPEQEGQEGAERRQGTVQDWPEHALSRGPKGLLLGEPFSHLAVGIFHHHDAAIDQDANGQHHAEHHHLIERNMQGVQHQESERKAGRDSQTHHQALSDSQTGYNDDHHQKGRR